MNQTTKDNLGINNNHQQMSLYLGAMQIFDKLITNFNKKYFNDYPQLCGRRFPSKEQYQSNINIVFEYIYQRLSQLFQIWSNKFSITEVWQLKQNQQPQDNELYGILNEYKLENKKLKEQKKKLEGQVYEKSIQIEQITNNYKQVQNCFINCQKNNEKLTHQYQNMQLNISDLQIQLQNQLKKNQQLINIINLKQSEINIKCNQNIDLIKKKSELENQIERINIKNSCFESLIEQKIKNNFPKIDQIVKQQIDKKQNWESNSLKAFKSVLSYLNSKNKN